MKPSAWITLVLVLIVLLIFNGVSTMWGTGIHDYSPEYFLEQTVFSLRGWSMWIGFLLVAVLLYLERQGNSIGKYWVVYPIFRLVYDVSWMAIAGNPYPSWYVQDFGAFLICMPIALIIDHFGIRDIQADTPKADPNDRIKLWISIISLITALVGFIKALFS
ncbi:MAG: hypothetical protein JW934_18210 [Anaerolineae bacterium]|nr:hypothetical protein [Anaerolineae bacterium]